MAERNIWRTITTLGGSRKTVVATVLSIAAGALLWYERDDPRYPVTIDEAELIAAAYERHSVGRFTAAAPATNTVGLYPRRSVYRSLVPGLLRQVGGWSSPGAVDHVYLDLWHPSYANASEAASGWKSLLFRPYTNAAGFVRLWTWGEEMRLGWWRTNMYADAIYFGDYAYLHPPPYYTLYNNARLLDEAARPLALMRWTAVGRISDYDAWVDEDPGLASNAQSYVVRWVGNGEAEDTIEAAYASSLAALAAAPAEWWVNYTDQWEELSSGDFARLAKQRVAYHYVFLSSYYNPSLDIYQFWMDEHVSFVKSPHAVVPSHPHGVKSFGYYRPPHHWDDSAFWHLTEYPNEWTVSDVTLVTNHPTAPGGQAYRSGHGFWHGRVPAAALQALMPFPPLDGGTSGHEIGFKTQESWGADDRFIFDHHFQALTNPAAVWSN